MDIRDQVAHMRRLSNDALVASLGSALGSSRRLTAVVVAHLGEVEERRLHLLAGYESMFAYCTRRLGMSEDEACRRIEVGRLARRFPAVLVQLADGLLSLSVAALLRSHLDEANHVALLAEVSGKTVSQAREVLAAWFPRPDAPASIRKLPDSRGGATSSQAARAQVPSPLFQSVGVGKTVVVSTARDAGSPQPSTPSRPPDRTPEPVDANSPATAAPLEYPKRSPPAFEPLSPERYRVVFTADAELKQKLDLARDLLRHSVPSGDLATTIGRALDLLIEKTMQRRFGQKTRRSPARASARLHREPSNDLSSSSPGATPTRSTPTSPSPSAASLTPATPNAATSTVASSTAATSTAGSPRDIDSRVIDSRVIDSRVIDAAQLALPTQRSPSRRARA